jgi:hypothetical protein
MRRLTILAFAAAAFGSGQMAVAQEHYTEGPVWACAAYRTKPGQTNSYMKYLREHFLPTSLERKAQGLVVDTKVFVHPPARPDDWDVAICTLHASYGKALDYNAEDEKKGDAIQEAHWKTKDQEEMRKMSAKRFEMRDFLGVSYDREVMLKPLN